MANGVQNGLKPGSTTWTTLVTGPTSGVVVNLSICNESGSDDTTYVAVVPNGSTRGSQHNIEGGTTVTSKTVIERTGIVLASGDTIQIYSGGGNLSFVAWGVDLG